ncbi:926_t:CDS:1, partial [Scutellospora calospora]
TFYKQRIDAVCNYLLKRFENEQEYIEYPEDIEFLKKMSEAIENQLNFPYIFFDNDKKLLQHSSMNVFCLSSSSLHGECLRSPYNYFRIRLFLSNSSKFKYSKFLNSINNLFEEKLEKTLSEYFSLYPTDFILSNDLLAIILLVEPFYFSFFRKDEIGSNPINIDSLKECNTYSQYKRVKGINATSLISIQDNILYNDYINKFNKKQKDEYLQKIFFKLKDCGISEFIKHDDFYKRYSILSEEDKNLYYSVFQNNYDKLLI